MTSALVTVLVQDTVAGLIGKSRKAAEHMQKVRSTFHPCALLYLWALRSSYCSLFLLPFLIANSCSKKIYST